MQRIFKYGDIQNTSLTPDKELKILIYGTPSYVIIYRGYTLLKMVKFFWPTLYFSINVAQTITKNELRRTAAHNSTQNSKR